MKTNELLAWIDIETTGLDPKDDDLLEVALIVTDQNMTELYRRNWVLFSSFGRDNAVPVVQEMHEKNGLWDDVEKSDLGWSDFLYELIDSFSYVLAEHPDYKRFVMAGSGVARFDFKWFEFNMPGVINDYFAYYTLDIGVVRRALELAGVIEIRADEQRIDNLNHRAMQDIEDHIEEWNTYRLMLSTLQAPED